MKVRFGFTCRGSSDIAIEDFGQLCESLETFNFDSIWLPETMLGGSFDPIVALSHVAARTKKLKIGSHMVLPGRDPFRLAKELAHLDRMSNGRLLLIAVLGLPDDREIAAQGVERPERGAMLAEIIPLLRRLWSGETVSCEGGYYKLLEASVDLLPKQKPLEIWLGGTVPSALRRAGELGDGYIPGLSTPEEGRQRKQQVEEAAQEFGRIMDPEHFGVNLSYSRGPLSSAARESLKIRRPDVEPETLVPTSSAALSEAIDQRIAAGYSKFLLRPMEPPANWHIELERLASDVLGMQT